MGTALGVVIGIVVTVLVSRYYFQRSINKSIGIYGLLNSYVFAGIAADVRNQLHFRFQNREVRELQQIVFLVANDGEKSIRDVIEPLLLQVPPGIEILDASIVHRFPDALKVELRVAASADGGSDVTFDFPILNRREFFVVKLLLSGRLELSDAMLTLLAEDLPRSLPIRPTPPDAITEEGYKFDWGTAFAGVVILSWLAWFSYWLSVLRVSRPDLFPYPWSSFRLSIESLLLLIPGAISFVSLAILGVALLGTAMFAGRFRWPRGPRFPLPQELREAVFPYQLIGDISLKPTAWTESQVNVKPILPIEDEGILGVSDEKTSRKAPPKVEE